MTAVFADFEVIDRYTRADAIRDGILIDLTANFPDISRQLYKYPVSCTAAVWSIVEAAVASARHCNDYPGMVWDLLWMSQKGTIRRIDDTQHIFRVIITGAGRKRYHDFKIMCHGGDQGEPVLTILLPEED